MLAAARVLSVSDVVITLINYSSCGMHRCADDMFFHPAGDLAYHLGKRIRFSEHQARFYAAEILLGIEHLHKANIVYRFVWGKVSMRGACSAWIDAHPCLLSRSVSL
jgi:hypothetical protein